MESRSITSRFFYGVYWNILGKFLFAIFGFFVSVVLARGLGREQLGLYAVLIAIPVVCRLFVSFGVETIINIRLPQLLNDPEGKSKIRYLLNSLVFLRLLILVLLSCCLFLLLPVLTKFFNIPELSSHFSLLICYLAGLVFYSFFSMIPRAILEQRTAVIIDCVNQGIILLILVATELTIGLTIKEALGAFVVSNFLMAFLLLYLYRGYFIGSFTKISMRENYEICVASFLQAFLYFFLGQQIDVLLMKRFDIPGGEIGLYHLGINLGVMMGVLSAGYGIIAQSVLSERYNVGGKEALASSWRQVVKVNMLLNLPFVFFGIVLSKAIITAFYGLQFSGAVILLQVYAGCYLFHLVASMGNPCFYLLRYKKQLILINLLVGVANLLLDLVLIPQWGAMGAVIATGFSIACGGVIQVLFLWTKEGITLPYVFIFKLMLVCMLALLLVFVLPLGEELMGLIVRGGVYLLIALVLARIFKLIDEEDKGLIKSLNPQIYWIAKYL
jgi:O-antigen/teichoic acid export membrane protein